MAFPKLKKRNNSEVDDSEEYPDGAAPVVEETLENASNSKRDKNDESVDYSMSVDWGRKYKPAMTFASKSIVEAKNTKVASKMMKKLAISAAGVMVVLSAATLGASMFINAGLAKEQAINADTKKQVEALQPVAKYYDDFVISQGAASAVLSKDIVWSKIQDQLAAALPEGSKITNEATRYGQVCASPTPFEPSSTIGCVSLDVTVPSYAALGTLIDNLDQKSESISDPYVTTTSNADEVGVTAAITFNFNATVVSTKYSEFLQESKDAGVTPAAPAADPAAPAAPPAS